MCWEKDQSIITINNRFGNRSKTYRNKYYNTCDYLHVWFIGCLCNIFRAFTIRHSSTLNIGTDHCLTVWYHNQQNKTTVTYYLWSPNGAYSSDLDWKDVNSVIALHSLFISEWMWSLTKTFLSHSWSIFPICFLQPH